MHPSLTSIDLPDFLELSTPRSSLKRTGMGLPSLSRALILSWLLCEANWLLCIIFLQQRKVGLKRSYALGPKCHASLLLRLKSIFSTFLWHLNCLVCLIFILLREAEVKVLWQMQLTFVQCRRYKAQKKAFINNVACLAACNFDALKTAFILVVEGWCHPQNWFILQDLPD